MNLIFGICGILGGLLCASGDMLLDLKGKDNRELGKYQLINSNWEKMDIRRFGWSVFLAFLGVPLAFLGLTSLARQIAEKNNTFALVFWIMAAVGCISGFFIHAFICLLPVIFKTARKGMDFDGADEVVNAAYRACAVPFWVGYLVLVGCSSVMVGCALVKDYLVLSPWMTLLTPMSLLIIGLLLRAVKRDWFYDLPGIIMPSMGFSMLGLMAVLNTLA